MPLRDHFHSPIKDRRSWQSFHATWPIKLVDALLGKLPEGFVAEPRATLGKFYELDIGVLDSVQQELPPESKAGGVATLPRVAPRPTMTTELDIGEHYEFEVLIHEEVFEKRLVAAVEFVSPANKDRAEHRKAFVAKCGSLLQSGVCVAIVDVVTTRSFNLYEQLLDYFEVEDSLLKPAAPGLYCVSCRSAKGVSESRFETWFYPIELGKPIPELPVWLDDGLHVMLDLEGSYEQTCKTLQIA
ncbi:MAG: DUF4058 family protein [Gemmataceae bacterium]